ncbi:RNA 2',3'-cyclic phosphodiesterase [Cohnella luojiensis]|uniref:RNA 2',3'-cyclic phosphodiesterase n=1 Tax=Cohnella luojiensis TaxID=652876 RepID=A0A4Y8LNK6_9BACL|nr:RNA 2',3'-cyclic phosphodiesterase [Cohnella luojiensis]TFE19771.1 RNA 2',3'-cyclic phosphodiesterase [Cohnella luojiensis]
MNNFRLFLGLRLSEAAAEFLSSKMTSLVEQGLTFRSWTHPADLHVTLHFLGDTPASRVPDIGALAAEAAAATAPFALALTEAGTFGPPSAPRVLWCGLAEPAARKGALAALHAALGARLAASGFAAEARPFRAHVTLARGGAAGCSPAALVAAWHGDSAAPFVAPQPESAPRAQEKPAWTADGCTLFRTHLGRKPSYEAIGCYPFKS